MSFKEVKNQKGNEDQCGVFYRGNFIILHEQKISRLLDNRACARRQTRLSHHILPLGRGTSDFMDVWKESGIDPNKFKINMDTFFHRKMHGRGGGKWNQDWKVFLKIYEDPKKERIMGFAYSVMKNIGMSGVPFL